MQRGLDPPIPEVRACRALIGEVSWVLLLRN